MTIHHAGQAQPFRGGRGRTNGGRDEETDRRGRGGEWVMMAARRRRRRWEEIVTRGRMVMSETGWQQTMRGMSIIIIRRRKEVVDE